MKYKNYIWIVFIFVAVLMIYGMSRYLKPAVQNTREGFMTDAEYLDEINHRIKSIQTIRGSILTSLDSLDVSAKESCDLSIKYRDAYIAATAALPKYESLKSEERLQNAKEDYVEEKTRFASQNTPMYECFENPPPSPAAPAAPAKLTPVQEAQMKLMAEIAELNKVLESRRLRIAKDKGKLVQGLQEFNSTFSGTQLMNEMSSAPAVQYAPVVASPVAAAVPATPVVSAVAKTSAVPVVSVKIKVAYIGMSDTTLTDIKDGLEELNEQNNIEIVNITNKVEDLKYPKYNVLFLAGDYGRSGKNITEFVANGGNAVYIQIWDSPHIMSDFDYQKYTSIRESKGREERNPVLIKLSRVKSHPILTDDVLDKEISGLYYYNYVDAQDKDHIIASFNTPIILVRTRGSSRYVSINFAPKKLNIAGQKVLARCLLWAAGRI